MGVAETSQKQQITFEGDDDRSTAASSTSSSVSAEQRCDVAPTHGNSSIGTQIPSKQGAQACRCCVCGTKSLKILAILPFVLGYALGFVSMSRPVTIAVGITLVVLSTADQISDFLATRERKRQNFPASWPKWPGFVQWFFLVVKVILIATGTVSKEVAEHVVGPPFMPVMLLVSLVTFLIGKPFVLAYAYSYMTPNKARRLLHSGDEIRQSFEKTMWKLQALWTCVFVVVFLFSLAMDNLTPSMDDTQRTVLSIWGPITILAVTKKRLQPLVVQRDREERERQLALRNAQV
ncbi:unnamed protein product [Amoebophrya sp. A25]|nr:unnamed protein product [Amoebophrya sp. A25]|eukprot:GSA25T00023593001.1